MITFNNTCWSIKLSGKLFSFRNFFRKNFVGITSLNYNQIIGGREEV